MTARILGAVLMLCSTLLVAVPATAGAVGAPPTSCRGARLVSDPHNGTAMPTPRAGADGRYTPVLLVHGWNGAPQQWSSPINRSTLPYPPKPGRSLAGNLQGIQGSAVYTLDYHDVAGAWFTVTGAGGQRFLDAAHCLLDSAAFTGHKMIVVGHSMGGLITRWAANTDPAIGARLSLAITLGTPYEGSQLAAALAFLGLVGTTAARNPVSVDRDIALIQQMISVCHRRGSLPGCAELRAFIDHARAETDAVTNFVPGSAALTALADWPASTKVETLTNDTVIEDAPSLFGARPGGPRASSELSIGDGAVARASAVHGPYPETVATCRFTGDPLRAAVDGLIGLLPPGLRTKADIDRRGSAQLELVSLIFGEGTCSHNGELQTIQLTNEALGAVADQIDSEQPRTKTVTVTPVTASINPKPGYRLRAGTDTVFGCMASPAAAGPGMASCYPSAAGADVCWVRNDRRTLICGTNPWDKDLIQVTSDEPLARLSGTNDADPWGLELENGLRCRLRNGGSWGARSDEYTGAAYCQGSDDRFVLAKPNTPILDRSSPVWTVKFGELGEPAQNFPPPQAVRVRTAYFAGTP